jgi:hypothetical protein
MHGWSSCGSLHTIQHSSATEISTPSMCNLCDEGEHVHTKSHNALGSVPCCLSAYISEHDCRLLAQQLAAGALEPPFNAMPPGSSLPTLQPWLAYRYASPSKSATARSPGRNDVALGGQACRTAVVCDIGMQDAAHTTTSLHSDIRPKVHETRSAWSSPIVQQPPASQSPVRGPESDLGDVAKSSSQGDAALDLDKRFLAAEASLRQQVGECGHGAR